eukprot:gene42056-51342_t
MTFLALYHVCSYKLSVSPKLGNIARAVSIGVGGALAFLPSSPSFAADKQPPIPVERYFKAVQDELDPEKGKSLLRLRTDLSQEDWKDILKFTREYDAGFRGTVLKGVWKQLEGEKQKRGIEISNSFTFDLIGVNKAARVKDAAEATKRINMVEQDLRDFLQLQEISNN